MPEHIDLEKLRKSVSDIAGVRSIHDLHVWSITSGKISLTMHVVSDLEAFNKDNLLKEIQTTLAEQWEIHHTTIQMEAEACDQATNEHTFGPTGESEKYLTPEK